MVRESRRAGKSFRGEWVFLLLGFLTLAVLSARADPASVTATDLLGLSLEELMEVRVTGASRYEQKTGEAPSFVTVITAEEIRRQGYRTLTDILESIPGLYVSNDRNYQYLGMRGYSRPGDYNSRVLLLLDGHRFNDNIYDQAPLGGDFPLDLDLIDRVEYIRGPSSSLYGTNAFFGVINLVTRKTVGVVEHRLIGEAGDFGQTGVQLTWGDNPGNGRESLVSASRRHSLGRNRLFFPAFANPATNLGWAERNDGEQIDRFYARTAWKDLTLSAGYAQRDKTVPTGAWGTVFNDGRFRTGDDRLWLDLAWEKSLPRKATLSTRLRYDETRYQGRYPYDLAAAGSPPAVVTTADWADGRWWGVDLLYLRPFGEKRKLLLGGEFQDNLEQAQGNQDSQRLVLDDRRSSSRWALFAQEEFEFRRRWRANLGLRYDHSETFGGLANPRLAFIHTPDARTTAKLLYGRAFRAPNTYERYYQDLAGAATQKPSPDLEPEKIETFEAVLERSVGSHWHWAAAAFHFRTRDMIDQVIDADGLLVFRNRSRSAADGVELAVSRHRPRGVEGRASVAFQRVRDLETKQILSNSPRVLGKLNLGFPVFQDRWILGVNQRYLGNRKTLAGRDSGATVVTDLVLTRPRLIPGVELSVGVYNLFDHIYDDPAGQEHLQDVIPQDGRAFRIRALLAW